MLRDEERLIDRKKLCKGKILVRIIIFYHVKLC